MGLIQCTFEPRLDKTNKVTVRPAKSQNSLGIRPVWSVSSLCIQWVAKDPNFIHADSEDSDQTGGCPGWSESSLGAQPFCWFCHVATELFITLLLNKLFRRTKYHQIINLFHQSVLFFIITIYYYYHLFKIVIFSNVQVLFSPRTELFCWKENKFETKIYPFVAYLLFSSNCWMHGKICYSVSVMNFIVHGYSIVIE